MVASCRWGRWLAAVATVGLCLPSAPAAAQEDAPAKAHVIRDVELGQGGLLVGRLLDANGRPVHDAEVSVLSSGKPLAAMRTDANGVFAVSNLRGGVHEIVTVNNAQVCRLWAPGTAPPRVPKSIDVVADSDVVRGQYGPPFGNRFVERAKLWATNPLVVAGVVATAVAIPVAVHNSRGPHS